MEISDRLILIGIIIGLIIIHITVAIAFAYILEKTTKHDEQHPDDDIDITTMAFFWEICLVIGLLFGIVCFPHWIAKKMIEKDKKLIDDTKVKE